MTLKDLLLPYQLKFLSQKKRKKIFLASRQIGKSFLIAYSAVQKSAVYPGVTSILVSTGQRAASELLKKCLKFAESVKILSRGMITYTSSAECITFSNGSRILSLPNSPESVRGYSCSGILALDEAAFIEHIDDLYQAIIPTMTRFPSSELIVSSTPGGCQGLFYDLYTTADDDWYIQTTTIEDAVKEGLKIDIDELHKLCPDPDIFSQEYMCVFSKEMGEFVNFDNVDFYDENDEKGTYYLGMDIGRKNDRTGISVLKLVKDKIYLENIITLDKCEYQEQIRIVKDLHQKYSFNGGYIDEGGIGSAVAEQITKEISTKLKGLTFTSSNKTPLYENLRAKIFDHKIFFRNDFKQLLKDDFRNVKRIVTDSGSVKFEAMRSAAGHSDITSSIVLGIEAVKQFPVNFKVPQGYMRQSPFGFRQSVF